MDDKKKNHPWINEIKDYLDQGRLSRREFVRYAVLLGMSASAAYKMAGLVRPRRAFATNVDRGGTLRIAAKVMKVTHPAQFGWGAPANQMSQIAEYLTFTDEENITHPYLVKKWEASEDLKTWTLDLQQGATFGNGDEFTADDVVFTFNQWFDKDVGSSMASLLSPSMDASGVEKVSSYQVKLHLKKAEIAIPEILFMYPALVLNHRTFEGDFLKAPHGTGPYTLDTYREGERCVVKRRNDYWQKGTDGKSLPYLDAMEFIDLGDESSPKIAAIRTGEVDTIDLADVGGVETFQALKKEPTVNVLPVVTAYVNVLRMRVDVKPWDDNRVRMALKHCQNRKKILGLAYFGQGVEGHDTHVYPKHPEYCEKPTPQYDPDKAKALLKEAGHGNGLNVTISVANDVTEIVRAAEVLKEDAAPGGFNITIDPMPSSQYWEKWMEVPLGITGWMHRPLGTMALNLAYTADESGKPVPWNETRWVDKEFSELLHQANGILDREERRKIFCKLEDIQMKRGSVGISYWANRWYVARKRVHGMKAHPQGAWQMQHVWVEKKA